MRKLEGVRSLLLTVTAVAMVSTAQTQPLPPWQTLQSGLEVLKTEYRHRGSNEPVKVLAIRFAPRRFRLEVVDLSRLRSQSTEQSSTVPSLRLLAGDSRWVAGLNGSYVSSYAFPRPLGLVRVRGTSLARMSGAKPFSGVVCVHRDADVEIEMTKTDPGPDCLFALESGPMIVEFKGKNGIRASAPTAGALYERSAVCVVDERVVFIRTGRSALYDLGEFLRRDGDQGGMDCETAINMSGDADSGIFWRDGVNVRHDGSIDAALATALVVARRYR
jgi:hypothetical protein